MELLGGVGHWSLFSVHLETVLVSEQDRSTVCAKRTIASENYFWTHPMVLLGDKAILDAHFGLFGDRLRNHFGHTGWNT
jgi:hypothetical protein